MKHFVPTIVIIFATCSTVAAEFDFDTEIVPILSKAGCNAAACHGGAAGQAGFRLSLFGGNPEFDHRTMVYELEGRRVDFVHPYESLLLAKPTGQLDHGGEKVLDLDSKAALTIAAWISAGAQRRQLRQLDKLHVSPASSAVESLPAEVQLTVTAKFDDGTSRDVSEMAVYVSQNDTALQVDNVGKLTILRPGQHAAVVHFGGQVQTVSITSPIGSKRLELPASARQNWIDDQINATLETLRLEPTSPANDNTFLRRLSLDLTGRLPGREAMETFLADTGDSKRSKAVSQLLASAEFTEYWTYQLATQLRIRKPGNDDVAVSAFYQWIQDQVANDAGWDQIARELLLSSGDTRHIGVATVHRFFATAREEAEYVSEVLMGVRLRCANCHNHPLDDWTQDDYHGLAAIFAGLQRGQIVSFSGHGDVTHPRTGLAAIARIPGKQFINADGDPRQELVAWLTDRGNPYFARAMTGRVWESLMGRGLVTPVDDLRATNPATHPELFEKLSDYFVQHDYQLRPLIRLICNSAAYARSSIPLPDSPVDDRFFSHAISKELSAEVLADAISDVTGVGDTYGMPTITRAICIVDRDKLSAKLQFLGQCLPTEACSTETGSRRGVASKLHLMNGELLNAKIVSEDGHLSKMFTAQAAAEEMVTDFYWSALSRPPTDHELTTWKQRIDNSENEDARKQRYEDFLWSLLNCHEFTTNH